MLKFYSLLIFSCCIFCASTQTCSGDIFQNLKITKDGQEITVKSSEEIQDAIRLEAKRVNIPILCKYSFKNMNSLYKLDLLNNEMVEIEPGVFKNVPSLENLRISGNKISVIPNGVFNSLNIKRLDLKKNQIENIEKGAFDNMPELAVIEIDFNEIKYIDPSWFSGSPKVQRLSLADNKIESIPEKAFTNMANNVVDIWLMNNRISSVHPRAFEGITRANYLWLQDNRINEVDDNLFSGITEIERLSLADNKLKCVSDAFLANLHAKSVGLDANPIECKECLPKLKRWAKDKNVEASFMIRHLECVIERSRKVLNETSAL